MGYQCLHCLRTFSTPFGLKRHISDRHQYIADEGESSQSNLLPYEEPGLWNEDFIMEDEEDEEVEEDEEYEEDEPITLEQTEPHEDARFSEISEDKSKRAPDKNRLPKSTKEGRKFLDVNKFPYMKFKTVPITNFQDTIYNF